MSVKSSSSNRVLRSSSNNFTKNQNINQSSSQQVVNPPNQNIEDLYEQNTMEIDNVTEDNIILQDIPQNSSSSSTPVPSNNNTLNNIINNTIKTMRHYENIEQPTVDDSIHATHNNNTPTSNSIKGKTKSHMITT
ncbi:hypothetical protein C1645_822767 [Glomus cerebriforme]|uniref:Uncharacterized protein n=1 Tax=Glomus cerebriforme TaxID=658196 RepID=A0A397T459_9GLOM|nr:hypothetical protein C1645_822767 [Glomus cerebriforme]